MSVTFRAPPTVARFMRSSAFVRAIVGPIGSGKSSGCVMEIIRRAMEQAPSPDGVRRTRFAVIRNTYRQLEDTTRKTFEQWIPPDAGHWHEQPFTFEIERPLADGTRLHCEVLFRALDKPADVKKVLSLELTGAYFNELREIPKELFDGVQGRVGRYPSKAQGGPTWFGVWADTNPWPTSSSYYELFSKQRPEGFELFEQPGGRSEDAENVENLPPGYYERLCYGKDAEWVSEYVDGQYPSSDKGSIYGDLLDALERRGGLGAFSHPSDGVHAVLDLGVSDATAIWWFRTNDAGVPDVVDWYEATGKGASHFFEVLRSKPWTLRKIWLPHDARARTFQTGASTIELFVKEFGAGMVEIGPELSIEDGIGAGRWMLEQPIRVHGERCADGLRRLRAYRYVWDEDKKVFSKKPLHDWTSHTADSWRYMALVARHAWLLSRKPEPPKRRPIEAPKLTLDQLWSEHEESLAGGQ